VNAHSKHTHPTAAPVTPAENAARDRAARRVLRSAAGLGIALLAVPVAVAFALFGCGSEGSPSRTADNETRQVVHAPGGATTSPAVTASQIGAVDPAGVGLRPAAEPPSPDVTASVTDTLVLPGRSVQVTAVGTEDVRQVVLWDGIHDRQAFAYDSTSGEWRATYRMPP